MYLSTLGCPVLPQHMSLISLMLIIKSNEVAHSVCPDGVDE